MKSVTAFVGSPRKGGFTYAATRQLADRGDRRAHVLVYGTSALDRTAFREELKALSRQLALSVIHVLEQPLAAARGAPRGDTPVARPAAD